MLSFQKIILEDKLNKDSDFDKLAQAAIKAYYLLPYPHARPAENGVNRPHHGGVHVSSTALNAVMLFELYKKYKPDLLKHPITKEPLTERDLKLLKLAAIYHDSANTSEIMSMKGDEKPHADNFRRDMLLLGWAEKEIEPFAMAIQEKNKAHKKEKKEEKEDRNVFEKILSSADCLDILRIVKDGFKKEYLEIIGDLKEVSGFSEEMDCIIENHKKTINLLEADPVMHGQVGQLHVNCETSENCYAAVAQVHKEILLQHIIFSCLRLGKIISFSDVDLSKLSILDFYNRENSSAVKALVQSLISIPSEEKKVDDSNEKLFKQGCLVRGLRIADIDKEFLTLQENTVSLQKAGISTPEQMQRYIDEQKKEKVYTPAGFKWRPFSYCQSQFPIKFFSNQLAIIVNPSPEKGTLLHFFYKNNVASFRAKHGIFSYNPEKGSHKNKKTLAGLREKLMEQDQRRRGIIVDPGLHYFGLAHLSWSEVLGTYEEKGVVGIIVGTEKQHAKDALILRAKLGKPFRPFYRYTPEKGLKLLSEKDIIDQSGILAPPQPETIDECIYDLNRHSKGIFSISVPEKKERPGSYFDPTWNYNFSLPVLTRTLSYHMTSKDQAHILNAMRQLTKFAPKDRMNADPIISVDSNEIPPSTIFVTIEILRSENDNENNKCFLQILDTIRASVLGQIFEDVVSKDVDIGRKYLDSLAISDIAAINVSFKGDALEQKKLQYQFIHPKHRHIQCSTFMNAEGVPVISFESSITKEKISCPTDKLPAVSKHYAKQQIQELNQLLQETIKQHSPGYTMNIEYKNEGEQSVIQWKIRGDDAKASEAIFAKLTGSLSAVFKKVKIIRHDPSAFILQTPYILHHDFHELVHQVVDSCPQHSLRCC